MNGERLISRHDLDEKAKVTRTPRLRQLLFYKHEESRPYRSVRVIFESSEDPAEMFERNLGSSQNSTAAAVLVLVDSETLELASRRSVIGVSRSRFASTSEVKSGIDEMRK